jgi:sulfur transfer protein SufE
MFGKQERMMYLIDISDHFEEVPSSIAKRPYPETHRVKECESEAYVFPEPREDGTLTFHFAVENPQGVSAKAFSMILKSAVDGQPFEVINAIPETIVTDIFGSGLSMGKGLGLQGILRMVKYYAAEHAKQR